MKIPDVIRDQIGLLPKAPGVYFFKNVRGEVLYIGKATNLRDRVRSYWVKELNRGSSIGKMVTLVSRIDFEQFNSTMEAMIAEANYIKRYLPKYNIQFKDDKSYFYVKFDSTDGSGFARLSMVHKNQMLHDEKHIRYFGPYTSSRSLRLALKTIRKIFPYRSCTALPKKPCLQYHIKRCPAPCAAFIGEKEYKSSIRPVIMLLEGKKERLILQLKKEMERLAKRQEFEAAARVRNQYLALQQLHQMAKISDTDPELVGSGAQQIIDKDIPYRIEGYDVSNLNGKEASVSMVTFVGGRPAKHYYKHFTIRTVAGPNDYAMLQEAVERRILRARVSHDGAEEMINERTWEIVDDASWQLPDLIIIDGGRGQVSAVEQVLDKYQVDLPLVGVAKGPSRRRADLYFSNGALFRDLTIILAVRDEAHRFALAHHRIMRSKSLLQSSLDQIPGIGQSRRQALLKQLGSAAAVRTASFEDLEKIVGKKQAQVLRQFFSH